MKKTIFTEIDKAARELITDQPDGIIPVTTNFTIVCRTNLIGECEYEVYSYRTVVALVSLYVSNDSADKSIPSIPSIPSVRSVVRVRNDAFDHSQTTSRHLHRFITAMMEHRRVDWDTLRRLCNESKANGTQTVVIPTIRDNYS